MARPPLSLLWLLLSTLLICPAFAEDPDEELAIAEDPDTGELYYVDFQGIPLTPQEDPDYPSRANLRFDFARIIEKDPRLDGQALEQVWTAVPDHAIPLAKPGGDFNDPEGVLHVKGFHNGRIVYFLCTWEDATYDDNQGMFLWDDTSHEYVNGSEDQDTLKMMLRLSGDFWGYRMKGAGYVADEWRWGASTTNTTGYAEDRWRVQLRQTEPDLLMEKLPSEEGKPFYVGTPVDVGALCYGWLPAPGAYEGERVNNVEWREPEGSAGDVRARAAYDQTTGWTLEMARFLVTDGDDDRQLQTNERVDVAFAVTDGSGKTLITPVYSIRLLD